MAEDVGRLVHVIAGYWTRILDGGRYVPGLGGPDVSADVPQEHESMLWEMFETHLGPFEQ